MTCETNRIGVDNLQLIDFSEEDDYLIAFPFRDSLEDLRLSVTFDNVNGSDRIKLFGGANSQVPEQIDHVQSESLEPRRPSFLRKSLAWDSAFFTSAGVLNPEELFMINKGFKKAESNHRSAGTQKDRRPNGVAGRDQTSSDSDDFRLETLEVDLFEDVKSDIHKLSKRSKVATKSGGPASGQANEIWCKKTNICSQNKVKSVRAPKSQSLNLQNSKGMPRTRITDPQIIQDKVPSRPKLISSRQTNKAAMEGSDNLKMENKTRKAGMAQDLTVSKRSRWGDLSGLPKSTSFTSPTTEKDSKVHRSYESSSSASSSKQLSKSVRRKINPRNTKSTTSPSSVHFSLTPTCSSSTSPASSIDGWFSESLSLTSITHKSPASGFHNAIPASDFQSHSSAPCQNFEEKKFTSQYATRASIGTIPFSGGPKRKIKSSGLRMPSPKIGFFDEDQPLQPIFRGSMQVRFEGQSPLPNENRLNKFQTSNLSPVTPENCSKVRKTFNGEHDGRKVGVSCSKLKPDGQIPKEISKNRMNIEQKRQKADGGSFQGEAMIDIKKKQDETDQSSLQESQKENVCSFEDQVNGLSRYFEVIDLDRDVVVEVKGQRSCVKQQLHELLTPGQLSLPATAEHTTPCSRTPLAENTFGKQ